MTKHHYIGLAQKPICRQERDGGITIQVKALRYELGPERIVDALAFAKTWQHMIEKNWFSNEVRSAFVDAVCDRWLVESLK